MFSVCSDETYANTSIPFVDAKVAAALCKGGVVMYAVERESGISDGWIMDHVTPNMASAGIPRQVCLVLGRAMLWRIFDRCGEDLVPPEQRIRILQRYEDLSANNLLSVGTNPVKKIPLVVDGYDSEGLIDQVVGGEDDDTDNQVLIQQIHR